MPTLRGIYRACFPGPETASPAVGEVPEVVRRLPSARTYDAAGMMWDAEVDAGTMVKP